MVEPFWKLKKYSPIPFPPKTLSKSLLARDVKRVAVIDIAYPRHPDRLFHTVWPNNQN